jgi:hypothetical protein
MAGSSFLRAFSENRRLVRGGKADSYSSPLSCLIFIRVVQLKLRKKSGTAGAY